MNFNENSKFFFWESFEGKFASFIFLSYWINNLSIFRVKRGAENFSGSSANAKKERLDDYGKTAAQNNRNRQTAAADSTESRNLYETGEYNNVRFLLSKAFGYGDVSSCRWNNFVMALILLKNNFP